MAAVLTAVGCAIGMATLGAAPAFAVHDIGVFQLEGDAQASTPAGAVGDDWDEVCKAATGGAQCSTAGSLLASNTAAAWQNDGVQNATIFTTGGA